LSKKNAFFAKKTDIFIFCGKGKKAKAQGHF